MAEPPPNSKPHRLTQCYRHPNVPTTSGLCAPCLHERLSVLNPSSSCAEASTSFSSVSGGLPELRRCKTFSEKKFDLVVGIEPRRRSCDVRGLNSLSNLFDIDDDNGGNDVVSVQSRNLEFLEEEEGVEVEREVRVSDFGNVYDEFGDSKTVEELIDLELKGSNSKKKDFKEIAGSFWIAASVFSKKFRKWGKEQKTESECNKSNGVGLGEMKLENLRGRRLRDTQSEVGEYGFGRRSCDTDPRGSMELGRASTDCGGFGRRSCDTDPRLSIDLGMASIDCGGFGRRSCDTDPRFSIDIGRSSVDCGRISVDGVGRNEFEAPRASWDGYLLGARATLPRRNVNNAPMVSVIENAMATVYGFDNRVLSEGKTKVENGSDNERWRNLSGRFRLVKREAGVIEVNEQEGLSNARVSPAAIGIFNGTKLLITEKELNEWRLKSNSLIDDSSESIETASKDLASVSSCSNGQGFKKCRQWSKLLNIWGFLNRKKGDKFGNVEGEKENLESPDTESVDNNPSKLIRSQSSSSSRSSSIVVGSKAIVRSRNETVVLQRNRSARHSPNHLDNGLLPFYLTPLQSRRRNRLGRSRLKNSKSLARTVLRL
ncbi:protein OCTOPUS-like [Amaranthus tricolor]|uniref:protein OCTOPUS-like n=1 Tax=Amaranthus tricolor TaxID=29722 RepID=UPI0025885FC4|nr:protein OCTOPUS-like [Amaranthus tricolor]